MGLEFNYWLTQSFAISPQVVVVKKGERVETRAEFGELRYDATTTYAEIPLYAKFAIGEGSLRPYVFAGPALGVLLWAKERRRTHFNDGRFPTDIDETKSIEDDLTSIDFGINAGVGVSMEITENTEIALDGTYSLGLTDLLETTEFQAYSNSIRVMAALLFRL